MRPTSNTASSTWTALALLCALLLLVPACKGLTDPATPNNPSDLDGQNVAETPSFSGSITLGGRAYAGIADGLTDTFVTARVLDEAGNPVANGTPISFQITMGTVRPLGSDPAQAGQSTETVVFNGETAVAVRSASAGSALVTAVIANVASSASVDFERPQGNVFVSLVLQAPAGDTTNFEDNAPLDVAVAATVIDENQTPVPGQDVRFVITEDTSGTARLSGRNTITDASGEAFSILTVTRPGRVILEAKAIDPGGATAATSNQVITTTRAVTETLAIDLTFSDGSTVFAASAGTIGIEAKVADTRTMAELVGRRVEFEISSDTALVDKAVLAAGTWTTTDSLGVAVNAIITEEAGSTVVILARLVEGGETILSNTIVLTVN